MTRRIGSIATIVAGALTLLTPALAADGPSFAGDYQLSGSHDVAGELILGPDGHFRYMLAGGALDEQAEGRWVARDGGVLLYTEPRPKPAIFNRIRAGEPVDLRSLEQMAVAAE